MNTIESNDEILQCLIASEAVYDENPCEYIKKDDNLTKANKIKQLVKSSKEFLNRCYQPYMICTYSDNKIIAAFRGTDPNSKNDIKTDLLIKYKYIEEFEGKVHSGFYARSQFIPLDFFTKKLEEGFSLLLTGHSLGAAVGAIITLKLLIQEKSKASDKIKNISFIGFGSPLIGDDALAKFVNSQFKTHFLFIINENDLIPKMLYRDPTKKEPTQEEIELAKQEKSKKKEKKSKKEKVKENENEQSMDKSNLENSVEMKVTNDRIIESIDIQEHDAASKLVTSVIEKIKQEQENELKIAEENKKKFNHQNQIQETKIKVSKSENELTNISIIEKNTPNDLGESIDRNSIISAEEISEQELIESQIKQVEQEIMEQELLESQKNDKDLIFKKKSENLKVFLRRLSNRRLSTSNQLQNFERDFVGLDISEEKEEADNDTNEDDEEEEHPSVKFNSNELVLRESVKDDKFSDNYNIDDDEEEILRKLREAEENMKNLNILIDEAVEKNKERIYSSQKRASTSLWSKLSVKKTKIDSPAKVTNGDLESPNQNVVIEEQNIEKSKSKKSRKEKTAKSEPDLIDLTTGQGTEGNNDVKSSNKIKKRTLVKTLMKKLPRGTAFGYYHHLIVEDKNDSQNVVIVKNYDTEDPNDIVNFYNYFKPKENQSKINYLKKNMSFHYIVNYKANFIKLVTNLLIENSFFITNYDEPLLSSEISPDYYKLLCFKDKLSSVNLIIELKRVLPNVEFIFDAELNVPDLNLKIKLFEPYLVKPSLKKEEIVFVFNFFIKKSELKSIIAVNYSEIIFYSHFNQATIKFPNTFFSLNQPGFLAYRSTLDCNAIEIFNDTDLIDEKDSCAKLDDNISKISDEIVDDEEFWTTHL